MNTAKKFWKSVKTVIFQTGKNWVLKTTKNANFQNFFDGPRTDAPGRISRLQSDNKILQQITSKPIVLKSSQN